MHRDAQALQGAGQRIVQRHGQGLHQPDQQRGPERPRQRAQPAHHHHHKNNGAHGARHGRFGDVGIAANHPRQRRQRAAAAKHPHEHARHVVAQRLHHLGVLERGLYHQADARARQQQPHHQQHPQRHQHDERARLRELRAIQRKQRPLQGLGQAVRHGRAPPHQLHQLHHHIRQAERDQQLGHMAKAVDAAQAVALKQRAQHAHGQRRQHQRPPEPHHPRQRVGQISAQHVKTGVRKIEHAHHAENQRQPRTEHEQQQPVADAIEQRDHQQLGTHGWRRRKGRTGATALAPAATQATANGLKSKAAAPAENKQ